MAYGPVNVPGASEAEVAAAEQAANGAKTVAQEVSDKVGVTGDTGGSAAAGTVMGKLNKLISDLASHMTAWTAARAGYIDTIKTDVAAVKTDAAAAKNGTDEIKTSTDRIGAADDTGGNKTSGTIMGKLNNIIAEQENKKNDPDFILSSYDVVLNTDNDFKSEITWSRTGDAAVSAEIFDETTAKIKVSGNRISVTGCLPGETSIRVTLGESTSYASCTKVIRICTQYPSHDLAECTPSEIQALARSGRASNYWSIGDTVPIAINGTVGDLVINDVYYAYIIGFDHNPAEEGNNTIHFQLAKDADGKSIAFTDSHYGTVVANSEPYGFSFNYGGSYQSYSEGCKLRKRCEELFNALPEDWQNVISNCNKKCVGYTSAIPLRDKIWVLSSTELSDVHYESYDNSGKQYDYYKNGNSKIKYGTGSEEDAAVKWWTRSPAGGISADGQVIYAVNDSGSMSNGQSLYSYGFSPGFVVA